MPSEGLLGFVSWGAKVAFLLFVFIWLRGTLPRFRYDQLMHFGWKMLIPVAAVWILVTATGVALWGGSAMDQVALLRRGRARRRLRARGDRAEATRSTRAFALIVTLCSLSVIFGLLGSPFIAALQVIVYAGAIMVLFLFVLMLLNVKREEDTPGRGGRTLASMALVLVALLVAQVGLRAAGAWRRVLRRTFDASTRRMAAILFSPHFLYVFEATSVLILAALVGAVALAKKDA